METGASAAFAVPFLQPATRTERIPCHLPLGYSYHRHDDREHSWRPLQAGGRSCILRTPRQQLRVETTEAAAERKCQQPLPVHLRLVGTWSVRWWLWQLQHQELLPPHSGGANELLTARTYQ